MQNMERMFWGCRNLEEINVSNWDTSSATSMYGILAYCEKLSTIDVSNWDTSKVTDLSSMFAYCRGLTTLDVSNFNTSSATTMRGMFAECNILSNLNLENFDTTNVTNLQAFVSGCHNLTATITIRGTNCTEFKETLGWSNIFHSTSVYSGTKFTVNYTSDASSLVDEMIATKSESSNVIKGALVA